MGEFQEKEQDSDAEVKVSQAPDITLPELSVALSGIRDLQLANSQLLQAMDKKVHNEFAGVISRQQAELDMFREGLGRNAVLLLLKTFAAIYSDYAKCAEFDDAQALKSNLTALLEDVLQALFESGVEERVSVPGEKYSARYSKPVEKVKTGDKSLHGTVIESLSAGLFADKTVLVPERVKIYVFDATQE
ncbi:MAG: hypothetical protein LBC41_09375 [Clostridiales bacterium]|jgi:molecular chaperone GrpE (heat shock protein)|nr:hypothetical protein [Clostridiales bacterium]